MPSSENFWNKAANKYAASPVSDEKTYQKKLAETQSFLSAEMRILEFGCGTGSTAIHHAANVQHVDAIDIAQNMLEIGRKKANAAGIDNITFTQGTLTQFNADASSLDAVLGLNVIHLIPDRRRLITETARILKPGGVFITSTVCLGDTYWRMIKPLIPLGKLLGLMPDLFIIKQAVLSRDVEDAGFKIERKWFHGQGNMIMFMVARKIQKEANFDCKTSHIES